MTPIAPSPSTLFCAAVITAAHGVRGQVKVKCFLEDPLRFKAYSPYYNEMGAEAYKIKAATPTQKEILIVALEGVTTRNEAESLKGAQMLMTREALPDLSEDTYYHQDLIGLPVKSRGGAELGTIHALHNFGAGDLLEIKTHDGRLEMTPFTREAVPEINLRDKLIILSDDWISLLEGGQRDA